MGVSEHYAKRIQHDRFIEVQNFWPVGKMFLVTWAEQCVHTTPDLKEGFSAVLKGAVHPESNSCVFPLACRAVYLHR